MIRFLLLMIFLSAYADTMTTHFNVGATLKYNYQINTSLNTTTSNSQEVKFKIIKTDTYIEYYY